MFLDSNLLVVVWCLMFVVWCLLFVKWRCLLFVGRRVVWCLMMFDGRISFVACCSLGLFVVRCVLLVVRCCCVLRFLFFFFCVRDGYYVMFAGRCSLLVGCCVCVVFCFSFVSYCSLSFMMCLFVI